MKIKKNIVICSKPYEKFGYFGWPSIARQADGTIFVAASGLRYSHVCPWGRTIICKSSDTGETWTEPIVINNTPLDDRDAGIISLGGQRLAITWFTSNTLHYFGKYKDPATGKWAPEYAEMGKVMDEWDGDMCEKTIGSWLRVSPDGEYWGPVRRAPVNTPHGFIVLKDRTLFSYKCDNLYRPDAERGMRFDDPALGIDWPDLGVPPILSPKDRTHPPLAGIEPWEERG